MDRGGARKDFDMAAIFRRANSRRPEDAPALKAELAALRVINQQLRCQGRRKRRENARLASIIGAAVIEACAKQPDRVGAGIWQLLQASNISEIDRAFLAGKGWF